MFRFGFPSPPESRGAQFYVFCKRSGKIMESPPPPPEARTNKHDCVQSIAVYLKETALQNIVAYLRSPRRRCEKLIRNCLEQISFCIWNRPTGGVQTNQIASQKILRKTRDFAPPPDFPKLHSLFLLCAATSLQIQWYKISPCPSEILTYKRPPKINGNSAKGVHCMYDASPSENFGQKSGHQGSRTKKCDFVSHISTEQVLVDQNHSSKRGHFLAIGKLAYIKIRRSKGGYIISRCSKVPLLIFVFLFIRFFIRISICTRRTHIWQFQNNQDHFGEGTGRKSNPL